MVLQLEKVIKLLSSLGEIYPLDLFKNVHVPFENTVCINLFFYMILAAGLIVV